MKKGLLALCAMLLMLTLVLSGCGGGAGQVELNVLNWGDYIDESLLAQFQEEYPDIKVNYQTMATNEEMLVALQAQNSIYDICFPSDYIIEKLLAEDMLQPIDKGKLTNIGNIDEQFLDIDFDPGNRYSVPYMWGTVGILYNTTMVSDPVDSWNILWDEKYADNIYMYDSPRDTIGVALLKLGYDINTRDEAHLAAAQQALIDQKPLVKAYAGDDIKDKMIGGSGALAVVYSGDAMYCMSENPDLAYAVPNEGSNIWFDNMVMTKNCDVQDAAHTFMDFLMRPEEAAKNAEYIGYSTPNKAALEVLGPDYSEDPTYNPPQEVKDRCTVFHDLGDFQGVYNDVWLHVKAS